MMDNNNDNDNGHDNDRTGIDCCKCGLISNQNQFSNEHLRKKNLFPNLISHHNGKIVVSVQCYIPCILHAVFFSSELFQVGV